MRLSTATVQYIRLLAAILLPLTTPIVLWFFYDLEVFHRWPWVRLSLLFLVLDWLFAKFTSMAAICGGKGSESSTFGYGLLLAFFLFPILLYPGIEVLGIGSDPHLFYVLVALGVIHGVACKSAATVLDNLEENKRTEAKAYAESLAQSYIREHRLSSTSFELTGSWYADEYPGIFPPLRLGGPAIRKTIFVQFIRTDTVSSQSEQLSLFMLDGFGKIFTHGFDDSLELRT